MKNVISRKGKTQTAVEGFNQSVIFNYPRQLRKLVDLPQDYTELINSASSFACKNDHHDSRTPTMCLTCGTMLCSQVNLQNIPLDIFFNTEGNSTVLLFLILFLLSSCSSIWRPDLFRSFEFYLCHLKLKPNEH